MKSPERTSWLDDDIERRCCLPNPQALPKTSSSSSKTPTSRPKLNGFHLCPLWNLSGLGGVNKKEFFIPPPPPPRPDPCSIWRQGGIHPETIVPTFDRPLSYPEKNLKMGLLPIVLRPTSLFSSVSFIY